jgi:hypothetical protein
MGSDCAIAASGEARGALALQKLRLLALALLCLLLGAFPFYRPKPFLLVFAFVDLVTNTQLYCSRLSVCARPLHFDFDSMC